MSAIVLVFSFPTLWFLFVGCALLYTFGLLPSPSSIGVGSAVAIGIVLGVLGATTVVSLLFVVFFLCKNRNKKRKAEYPTSPISKTCNSPKLTRFSNEFGRLVNLDSLVPSLCGEGLLSSTDVEQLLHDAKTFHNSRSYQILHLLTILDRKGVAGVFRVIHVLATDREHAGHEDLAQILKEEYYDPKDEYSRSHSSPPMFEV